MRRAARGVAWAALCAVIVTVGCASTSQMPTYERSELRLMVSSETALAADRAPLSGGGGEQEVQKEVDRLLALKPNARTPAKVVLFELPSSGPTRITSSLKWLALRAKTSGYMKDALEKSGIFQSVDFLPEMLLPAGRRADLKTVRVAAARAQADGVLIYTTEAGYDYKANGWAILYPTLIGLAVAPGSDLSSIAISKAVLLDVHTGYIYAVLESYAEQSQSGAWAGLDWEGQEFDVRAKSVQSLADETAAKAKALAAGRE
jgi:hypothetical protein